MEDVVAYVFITAIYDISDFQPANMVIFANTLCCPSGLYRWTGSWATLVKNGPRTTLPPISLLPSIYINLFDLV